MSGTASVASGGLYSEAMALFAQGDALGALEAAETALVEGRDQGLGVFVISAVSYRRGMIGNAIKLVEEILENGGTYPDSAEILAVLYCEAGFLSKALYWAKEGTITPPDGHLIALYGSDFPSFATAMKVISEKPLVRSGNAALAQGKFEDAALFYEQHLMLDPTDVVAIDRYAEVLSLMGRSGKALGMMRTLLTLGGLKPTLMSRIGACLMSMGRHDQALAAHRAALDLAPNSIALAGVALADMVYLPAGRSDVAEMTRTWERCIDANAVKSPRPAPALISAESLVVGVLCSARRSTDELQMLADVLGGLNKTKFTLLGFGQGELTDDNNTIYRGLFDRWRNVGDLDVLTLGALIRGEGVGLLLDADGLRMPARAGLFLRNCAPIQAGWLHAPVHGAFPGGNAQVVSTASGQPGEIVVPGGNQLLDVGNFSVGAVPPSVANGIFSFGVDAGMAQITPDAVALWAQVLNNTQDAMLVLRDCGQFDDQENVSAVIDLFGNFGVAHRIDVVKAQLAEFAATVDVMLAPTVSVDVLSYGRLALAGVPVVTFAGPGQVGNLAAAFVGTEYEGQMVAVDGAQYLECARFWKDNRARLAAFRANPRSALSPSPAFDRTAYSHAFGKALLSHAEALIDRANNGH